MIITPMWNIKRIYITGPIILLLVSCFRHSSRQNTEDDPVHINHIVLPDQYFPEGYIVYRPIDSLHINGKPDEISWMMAPTASRFYLTGSNPVVTDNNHIGVKMLWDHKNIYLCAFIRDTQIWADTSETNAVSNNNTFVVMIEPEGNYHKILELRIDALNQTSGYLHSINTQGAIAQPINISTVRSSVYIDGTLNEYADRDRKWVIELELPLEHIQTLTDTKEIKAGVQWHMTFRYHSNMVCFLDGHHIKMVNPETGIIYPGETKSWSPFSNQTPFRTETWGIVQFSSKSSGTGNETIILKDDDRIRWHLRNIHAAQSRYKSTNGVYSKSIKKLFPKETREKIPFKIDLKLSEDGFIATCLSEKSKFRWIIDQSGTLQPGGK